MLVVGLTQFRAKLSEHLAATERGEGVLVAERGEPVALMMPEDLEPEDKARLLRKLARKGLRVASEPE
jgi:prevent-host-death family protein